jgi:tRNA A-37 threonylcarbamoyl transferase component Bud32/tetratricopeptide (TPR) repeat protein
MNRTLAISSGRPPEVSDGHVADLRSVLAESYAIQHEIGRGGMATVYLAQDLKHARPVAIKVMKPELSAAGSANRFLQEIRVTARLKHPNILPLLDSGEANGLPYFVMPYVDGGSLKDRLQREVQLPIDDAIRIACEVADALGAAHEHGLVHRDIKPANILLERDHAVVSDFGIVRAVDRVGADSITSSGVAIGTVGYMSPEQATGDKRVDARSDIYSLGCVLYEMLAGEMPFTGPSGPAVIAKQLNQPVMPVSIVRDTVPQEVDDVIRRALEKVAADRYANVAEFKKALEQAAQAAPGARRPRRKTPRRLIAASAISSAALLLALAATVARWPGLIGVGVTTPADTTRYVIIPFQRRAGVPDELLEVQLLHDALTRWSGLSVADPFQVSFALGDRDQGRLTPRDAAAVAREQGAGRYVRGELSRSADSIRVRAALYNTAENNMVADYVVRLPTDLGGADSVFARLVDRLLFRESLPEGVPARLGTTSLPARQAFASAQRSLEAWDLRAADSAFAAAASVDPGYAQAHLWLALVRAWSDAEPARWRIQAEQAQLGRRGLSDRDRTMADAVLAQARGQLGTACALWSTVTDLVPNDFAAWYGLAYCLANDNIVVPNRGSPSGFSFRASYHHALLAYQRAFRLLPSMLQSFKPGSYANLRSLFMTGGNDLREGVGAPPDTTTFAANPAWQGDSLAFVPYPRQRLQMYQTGANVVDMEAAVQHNRGLFREVALSWVASSPRSGDALEALALSFWLVGNPAALDTLRRARALVSDPAEGLRLAGAQVWMQLAFALPSQESGVRRARIVADSLLDNAPPSVEDNATALAALAALTGRANLAAAYAAMPAAAHAIRTPQQLVGTGPALLVYSVFGGPGDTLVALEESARSTIERDLPPAQRARARYEWMGRAATLAFPLVSMPALRELAGGLDYVLNMQADLIAGDTSAVRAVLDQLREARQGVDPATLTIDGVYPEAELMLAIGDVEGAAAWLDRSLGVLPQMAPHVLATPVRAASLMRAAVLRARVAQRLEDETTMQQWASVVVALWSDADGFLQPTVAEMRRLTVSAF